MSKSFRLVAAALALCAALSFAPASAFEAEADANSRAAYEGFLAAVDTGYGYDVAVTLAEDARLHNSSWGDRTAGSAAEHAAADWLAEQMREIGLKDVEKAAAACDLWQFNGASFQISGEDAVITPHSYATAGTPAEGITAEVLYLGRGTAAEYEGVDARGRIVLVDIDQRADWWITYPMLEAELHGAAAILSAQSAGFSEISPDAYNAQDICGPVSIPCVSISANDADYIKRKLSEGAVTATLVVDNVVEVGTGTTYNVVGRIKGKRPDYQIIVGAHYDTHFQGFQDDSCAVGLALSMAKAMIDSGYQPENDIVFCLHGAEEWGASYTMFDWTVGAWEMINTLYPEWQRKTLAFLNFELPAYEFAAYTSSYSAPEMYAMLRDFTEDYPLSPEPTGCFPEGVLTEGYQTYTYSDDFSYYAAGVPSTVNGFLLQRDMETVFPFYVDIYHSNFDTKDTYNENVFDFNIKYYGALAMYIDRMPALPLDFTAQAARLEAAMDGDVMQDAGVDVDAYRAALAQLTAGAQALKDRVWDVNARYVAAQRAGESGEALDALREEGAALTQKNLTLFKFAQDAFLGLMYEKPVVPHEAPQINVSLMRATVDALKAGDPVTAADEYAWQVNNVLEWYAMYFSPEVIAVQDDMFWGEGNGDNLYWGTGRMFEKARVEEATRGLIAKYGDENADFSGEIAIYEREIASQLELLKRLADQEIEDMLGLAQMMGA